VLPEVNQWVGLVTAAPLLVVSVVVALTMFRAWQRQTSDNRADYAEDRKRWADERAGLALEMVALRKELADVRRDLTEEQRRCDGLQAELATLKSVLKGGDQWPG
jgi:hypothetical protein